MIEQLNKKVFFIDERIIDKIDEVIKKLNELEKRVIKNEKTIKLL